MIVAKIIPPPCGEGGDAAGGDGWGIVGQRAESELERDFPTLAALRPVPPLKRRGDTHATPCALKKASILAQPSLAASAL